MNRQYGVLIGILVGAVIIQELQIIDLGKRHNALFAVVDDLVDHLYQEDVDEVFESIVEDYDD